MNRSFNHERPDKSPEKQEDQASKEAQEKSRRLDVLLRRIQTVERCARHDGSRGEKLQFELGSLKREFTNESINPDNPRAVLFNERVDRVARAAENGEKEIQNQENISRQFKSLGMSTEVSQSLANKYLENEHSIPLERSITRINRIISIANETRVGLSNTEVASLLNHIASGRDTIIIPIEISLMRIRHERLLENIKSDGEKLESKQRTLKRLHDFIAEMVQEPEKVWGLFKTNRSTIIASRAKEVRVVAEEADRLASRVSLRREILDNQGMNLALANYELLRANDPDKADQVLLSTLLSVPNNVWQKDPYAKECAGKAIKNLRGKGLLESSFSSVQIAVLEGRDKDALSSAMDGMQEVALIRETRLQVEQGGTISLVERSAQSLAGVKKSGNTEFRATGWGAAQPKGDIRMSDGTVHQGVYFEEGVKELIANAPEGMTPVLRRVPSTIEPVRDNARTAMSNLGSSGFGYGPVSDTDVQIYMFPRQEECILKKEDIDFAKPEEGEEEGIVLASGEHIESEELAKSKSAEQDLRLALLHHPSAVGLEKSGQSIMQKFQPFNNLFESGMRGEKTAGFSSMARGFARDLLSTYKREKSDLSKYYTAMKHAVSELKKFPRGAMPDDLEVTVRSLEVQLDAIAVLVNGNQVEELCSYVLSPDFDEDDWEKWFKTNGIVLASAISAAVLAAMAVPTGGLSAPAAILAMSAVTSVGSYVGSELGKSYVGMTYRSMRSDTQKLYNEEIDVTEYFSSMGIQVGTSFITSALLIGTGSYLGNLSRQIASKGVSRWSPKEVMARAITKTAKTLGKVDDLLEKLPGGQSQAAKFSKEVLQEFYEEGGEGGFEWAAASADQADNEVASRILKGCAFVFAALNCAKGHPLVTGSRSQTTLEGRAVLKSEDGSAVEGLKLGYEYSGTLDDLRADLASEGITDITVDGDTVRVEATEKVKIPEEGGTQDVKVVREYKRTNESQLIRNLRNQSRNKEGESVLEREYGLTVQEDGSCKVRNLNPKGKLSLSEYLRAQGVKVKVNEDGSVTATVKNEEVVISEMTKEAAKNSETSRVSKLAKANAVFYQKVIDISLDSGDTTAKKALLEATINDLPEPVRPLYRRGTEKFLAELENNNQHMEAHQGEEIQHLIRCVMEGEPADKIQTVIDRLLPHATYSSPTSGIPIIVVDSEGLSILKEFDVVRQEAAAINFGSTDRDNPSFMVMRKGDARTTEEFIDALKVNNSTKHEYHHFIWNFLQRSGFPREVNESSADFNDGFGSFRDEFAAYLVEGRRFGEIESEVTTYSENRDVLNRANKARDIADVCVQYGKAKGVTEDTFLYAAMFSRNFDEFEKNCINLLQLSDNPKDLKILFNLRYRNTTACKSILEQKGISVDRNTFLQFSSSTMSADNIETFGQLTRKVDEVLEFGKEIGADVCERKTLITHSSARSRLPVSDETFQAALNLPRELQYNVPLGVSLEALIDEFFRFRTNDTEPEIYANFINSSSELQSIFKANANKYRLISLAAVQRFSSPSSVDKHMSEQLQWWDKLGNLVPGTTYTEDDDVSAQLPSAITSKIPPPPPPKLIPKPPPPPSQIDIEPKKANGGILPGKEMPKAPLPPAQETDQSLDEMKLLARSNPKSLKDKLKQVNIDDDTRTELAEVFLRNNPISSGLSPEQITAIAQTVTAAHHKHPTKIDDKSEKATMRNAAKLKMILTACKAAGISRADDSYLVAMEQMDAGLVGWKDYFPGGAKRKETRAERRNAEIVAEAVQQIDGDRQNEFASFTETLEQNVPDRREIQVPSQERDRVIGEHEQMGFRLIEERTSLLDDNSINLSFERQFAISSENAVDIVRLFESINDPQETLQKLLALGIEFKASDLTAESSVYRTIVQNPDLISFLRKFDGVEVTLSVGEYASNREEAIENLCALSRRNELSPEIIGEIQELVTSIGATFNLSFVNEYLTVVRSDRCKAVLSMLENTQGNSTIERIAYAESQGTLASIHDALVMNSSLRRLGMREITRELEQGEWGDFMQNQGFRTFVGRTSALLGLSVERNSIAQFRELYAHEAEVLSFLELCVPFEESNRNVQREWAKNPEVLIGLVSDPQRMEIVANKKFQSFVNTLYTEYGCYLTLDDFASINGGVFSLWNDTEYQQRLSSADVSVVLASFGHSTEDAPVHLGLRRQDWDDSIRIAEEHPEYVSVASELHESFGYVAPAMVVHCIDDGANFEGIPDVSQEYQTSLQALNRVMSGDTIIRSELFAVKDTVQELRDRCGYKFRMSDVEAIAELDTQKERKSVIIDTASRLHEAGIDVFHPIDNRNMLYTIGSEDLVDLIVTCDPKGRTFVLENFSAVVTVPKQHRESYVQVLLRIDHSPSQEMQRVKDSLARSLATTQDPLASYEAVEAVFVKNNLPLAGKLYRVFAILYDPETLKLTVDVGSSPFLQKTGGKKRYHQIYKDILRVHVESDNLSLRSFLTVLQDGEALLQVLETEVGVTPDTEQQGEIAHCLAKFEALFQNSQLGQGRQLPAHPNSMLSVSDLSSRYKMLKQMSGAKEGQSLSDRVAEMFAKPIGYETVTEVLEAMRSVKKDAHERGLQIAEMARDGTLEIRAGDLLKGVQQEYLPRSLQDGFTCPEMLGAQIHEDLTPYDTDLAMVLPENAKNGFNYTVNTSVASGYGDFILVVKDRDQFQVTTTDTQKFDTGKLELFKTGSAEPQYFGIRTGFGSTQVDFIIAHELVIKDEKTMNNLFIEIAQNGFYIPIVDTHGNLIFTPEQYSKLRSNFNGISRFGGDHYVVVESVEGVSGTVQSRYREDIEEITRHVAEGNQETTQISREVQAVISNVLGEEGVELKASYDSSLGGARLYDIGSTGRGTNVPGDFDFDYTLKVDDSGESSSFKRAEQIAQKIIQRLGGTNNSHTLNNGGYQIRLEKAETETGISDVDIAILPNSQIDYFITHQAVEVKLGYIREHYGEQAYQHTVANVLLAKKVLKLGNAYKKVEHGGWGGVGVENWILMNGGNFLEACRTFSDAAHDTNGNVIPLDEFKKQYVVLNPGVNFRDLQHDNYTRYLTPEGYRAMLQAIDGYLRIEPS
ncbi:hypothetical protein KJ652_06355 [Patescibacteria group bacterium]|nr:hypothetical protein [Patescibacteria group bacterium]